MLTAEQVKEVRELWLAGKTHREIQETVGIPRCQEFAITLHSEGLTATEAAKRASQGYRGDDGG